MWAGLHRLVLDGLGACGELDRSRCAIDSVTMRALKKGDLTGPNPVDRGKYGSKIHLIAERTGLSLSVAVSDANLHDSQALIPLVRGIPPIRWRRGPRRRKPEKLHADKGYDYSHLQRWLRQRGTEQRIARKGIESSQRLGRHRWTVERTKTWLAGCRRLHRRYERKAEHFLAFTSIACTPHLLPQTFQMRWLLTSWCVIAGEASSACSWLVFRRRCGRRRGWRWLGRCRASGRGGGSSAIVASSVCGRRGHARR